MADRILVPVDGSPQSEEALSFALSEWPEADVTLLHVIDPVEAGYSASVMPSGSEEWYKRAREGSREIFEQARETYDREFSTRTEVGRPSRTIVEAAADIDADHVVIGSHGREGVQRVLLGSVAEHVVRRSPVPVTVVRKPRDGGHDG
jgi:nucleotide-binding universal stress UspA family protein